MKKTLVCFMVFSLILGLHATKVSARGENPFSISKSYKSEPNTADPNKDPNAPKAKSAWSTMGAGCPGHPANDPNKDPNAPKAPTAPKAKAVEPNVVDPNAGKGDKILSRSHKAFRTLADANDPNAGKGDKILSRTHKALKLAVEPNVADPNKGDKILGKDKKADKAVEPNVVDPNKGDKILDKEKKAPKAKSIL